jgi:hypothetical protein
MGTVGRIWYLRLTQGRLNGVAEVGTYQVGQKATVWHRLEVRSLTDAPTEDEVLSELYSALLEILEHRASTGAY